MWLLNTRFYLVYKYLNLKINIVKMTCPWQTVNAGCNMISLVVLITKILKCFIGCGGAYYNLHIHLGI